MLILELAENGDLASHLSDEEKRTRLTPTIRVNILCEVARAIHFLHNGGVIDPEKDNQKYIMCHRDIKPQSICLDANYSAKLINCGSVKFDVVMGAQDVSMAKTMIKSENNLIGRNRYSCPHSFTHYEAKCDVFSFGVVIRDMISDQEGIMHRPRIDEDYGQGWEKTVVRLRQLASDCLEYNLEDRPDFKEISDRLSLIQRLMTRVLKSHSDSEHDGSPATSPGLTCGNCSNPCSKSNAIICSNGHIMDSPCCALKIMTFLSSDSRSDRFRCPRCRDRIDIEMLVHKVPDEYVMLLQKRCDDLYELRSMGQLIEGMKVEVQGLKGQVKNMEADMSEQQENFNKLKNRQTLHESNMQDRMYAVYARLFNIETDLKQVHEEILGVCKSLTNIAAQGKSCPQYIFTEPAPGVSKGWFTKKIKVYFICELSMERVPAFEIDMGRNWVAKVAPVIKLSLQLLIKVGTSGLDGGLFEVVADGVTELLDERFHRKLSNVLSKSRLSSAQKSNELKNDKDVMMVVEDAYVEISKEAEQHDEWKKLLQPLVTPNGIIKYVKSEKIAEARAKWGVI